MVKGSSRVISTKKSGPRVSKGSETLGQRILTGEAFRPFEFNVCFTYIKFYSFHYLVWSSPVIDLYDLLHCYFDFNLEIVNPSVNFIFGLILGKGYSTTPEHSVPLNSWR